MLHKCCYCDNLVEVEDDYKPIYCCYGRDCGCMGAPVNTVFCDECDKKAFEMEIKCT